MASLLYGAGLRLLECCSLRVKDVDFARRELMVRNGRGQKDRRGEVRRNAARRWTAPSVRMARGCVPTFFGRIRAPSLNLTSPTLLNPRSASTRCHLSGFEPRFVVASRFAWLFDPRRINNDEAQVRSGRPTLLLRKHRSDQIKTTDSPVAELPRLEKRNVEHGSRERPFSPSFKRSRVVTNHDRPRFWSEPLRRLARA